MKKFPFILSVVITLGLTVFCFLWALLFRFDPVHPQRMSPMFPMLWTAFWGFTIVAALQGTFKTIPSMICSACCGPFYGLCFFTLLGLCLGAGLGPALSFAITAVVVTFLLTVVHIVVLGGTWFGNIPILLGSYGIWFAFKNPADSSDLRWLYGTLFFMFGTVFATVFVPIALGVVKRLERTGPPAATS
jgi:hypothetical protein